MTPRPRARASAARGRKLAWCGLRRIDRQQHRVELVEVQGPAQHLRVVVAGDPDEPGPTLLLGLAEGLESPAGRAQGLHFLQAAHVVHLPQVQVVGVQVLQGDGQMGHGLLIGAAVGLAGEEDLVPVALQAPAQIGFAAGVGPGGLEVADAGLQGRVDDRLGVLPRSRRCAALLHPPNRGWWPGGRCGPGGGSVSSSYSPFQHSGFRGQD